MRAWNRSKRALGPLTLVMALLLFPSVAADSSMADFEFSSAVFRGDLAAAGPRQHALVFVPPNDAEKGFAWSLEAEQIQLNWSWTSRYEFSRPGESSAFTYAAKEPPKQWDEATSATSAVSQGRTAASNLVAVGFSGTMPRATVDASDLFVDEQENAWRGGSETGAEVSIESPINTRVHYELPPSHLQVQVRDAHLQLSGDLSIAVWEADVSLKEGETWRTVASGRTFRDATPNIQEADYRLLWIHAKNASLVVDLHEGNARLAAPEYDFEGSGVASFQGSKGVLTNATGTYAIDRQPVRVTGVFDALLRASSSSSPQAQVAVTDGRMDFAGALVASAQAPSAPGRTLWPWAWAALVLVPMVWMGVRRIRPVTIDEVEWAILAGKSRRSLRLAKRLVGRTPKDPDAVFLYGTTMLARGQLASVVETIEPLSLQIQPKDRRGIAFVLAVAAHGSNDARRARRWAKEAAQDPLLRDQLEKNGVLRGQSSFLQSGYA